MSSDQCRLLDLSPEVLILVASHCDGWSLLRLIKTCRTIRSLCDDVLVWQAAFGNRLDRALAERYSELIRYRSWSSVAPGVPEPDFRRAVPHGVLKKWLGNDKDTWRRTLIAFEKAESMANFIGSGAYPEEECENLPHLVVLGCMTSLPLNFASYIMNILEDVAPDNVSKWWQLSYDNQSRLGFCFASQWLFYSEKIRGDSEYPEWGLRNPSHTTAALQLTAFTKEIMQELDFEVVDADPRQTPLLEQALLFRVVGVVTYFARKTRPPSAFPLFDRLPLVDLGVKPPVPFWESSLGEDVSWTGWLRRYNAAASQESSLKGEWLGVFSEGTIIHPMTENIHFRHEPFHDEFFADGPLFDFDHHGTLSLSADYCIDPVGQFSLKSQIDVGGSFYAEKSYIRHSQLRWYLEGAMTPFGIVGRWSLLDGSERGYFWLYKRAWCTPSTETLKDLPTSNITIEPYSDSLKGHLDDLESDDLDSFDEDLDEESSAGGDSVSEEWTTEDSHDEESEDDDNNTQEGSRVHDQVSFHDAVFMI